jgi:hypothetical protein
MKENEPLYNLNQFVLNYENIFVNAELQEMNFHFDLNT